MKVQAEVIRWMGSSRASKMNRLEKYKGGREGEREELRDA